MGRIAAAAAALFALALVGAAMFSADDTAAVVAQQRFLTDSFRRMLWLEVMLFPYANSAWACLSITTGPVCT